MRRYKERKCVLKDSPKYLARKRGLALRMNLVVDAEVVMSLRRLAKDTDVSLSKLAEKAIRTFLRKEEYL
jgi:post-segregation antitoxin (ccd killing protein)